MNPITNDSYQSTRKQSQILASRMRNGTDIGNIINGQDSATHYIDSLERFQKDFSVYDKQKRQEEKVRRMYQLERKRMEYLQRENKRWEVAEQEEQIKQQKIQHNVEEIQLGKKRTCNSNGLAYNPINLIYDKNPQGERLKLRDEDHKVRGYVRAYNMDHNGNSPYNPLNGEQRGGISKIVPEELNNRYQQRLREFQDHRRIKIPQSSNEIRRNIFQYY